MECTQRLESTQDLCGSPQEMTYSDQIGVLGICGKTYPVKKGPNKVGRDPHTCNIVLDLNSVSRQHAVINILNSTEFMIMDLDSANKTKLLNKTLPPYIPHVLKHGDTVQFGQVFGVFRLLNDNSDLPMTQALDIPDTPLVKKYVAKFNNFPHTIPESPNVSDKDESFIGISQPKTTDVFKNASSYFIKKSGKTVAIQPVGTNKIDNIFWNSSRKYHSIDMDLDGSTETTSNFSNLKTSRVEQNLNIHEMETQVPYSAVAGDLDTIYTANTQICTTNPVKSSISSTGKSLVKNNNLPDIMNINNQLDVQHELFVGNKENNNSIYNADKRQLRQSKEDEPHRNNFKDNFAETSETGHIISDEEILFEEVESQPFEENFESQPLIHPESVISINFENEHQNSSVAINNEGKTSKKITEINSDNSTGCEDFDMLLTQKVVENQVNESICEKVVPDKNVVNYETSNSTIINIHEDSTDCEDNVQEDKKKNYVHKPLKLDDDSTDCEDDSICFNSNTLLATHLNSKSPENFAGCSISSYVGNPKEHFKDKTTITKLKEIHKQVIKKIDLEKVTSAMENTNVADFEDLSTQIIPEEMNNRKQFAQSKTPTENSPFKVPMQSAKSFKKREYNQQKKSGEKVVDCVTSDDNFYTATQEIINDLCSQKETHSEINEPVNENQDKPLLVDNLCESSNSETESTQLIKIKSTHQINDESVEARPKRKIISSDSSDVDCTPKKLRPCLYMNTKLPNSQEIKTSVTVRTKTLIMESSSDSGSDNDLEEEFSPVSYRKQKRRKNTEIGLTRKCQLDHLPTKVITRIRKPTTKVLSSSLVNKNYLFSRLVIGQEQNIDMDIITDNISRLKSIKNDCGNELNEIKNSNRRKLVKSDSNYNKLEPSLNLSKSQSSRKVVESKNNVKIQPNYSKTNVNETPGEGNKDYKCLTMENDNQKTLEHIKNDHKSHNVTASSKRLEESVDSLRTLKRSSRIKRNNEQKNQSSNKSAKMDINNDNKKETSRSLSTSHRNSRSRRKDITSKPGSRDVASISDDKNKQKLDNQEGIDAKSTEIKLRRSKRQKIVKPSADAITEGNSKKPVDKIIKNEYNVSKTHKKTDNSIVFSMSSSSGVDSPGHKNSETLGICSTNLDLKKKITARNSGHNMSTRDAPRQDNTQFVLFTAFPSEEVKPKLERLGAIIVTDVKACTVLLTLEIKRTFKLLCAVGLGRPIVGPSWVQACVDTKMIVDPWQYLIKDEVKEKRFQFNLQQTLTSRRNFLKGYNVSSTPSVMPGSMEMKLIVECSGGLWKEGGPRWLCVSSTADKALWAALKRRGATIVNTELILGGALRQKLDIDRNKLA